MPDDPGSPTVLSPTAKTGNLTTGSTPTYPVDAKTGEALNLSAHQDSIQLLKGALIAYDPEKEKLGERVYFQYNPQKLSRTLTSPEPKKDEQGKLYIPLPSETIKIDVYLQAIDLMVAKTKSKDLEGAGRGLYAQLATLELLLYPSSKAIKEYYTALKKPKGAVKPSARPLLFQWGPRRLLPVYLTGFSVEETEFNIALSPIVATVTLNMKTQEVLKSEGLSYNLLLQNLEDMEALASYEKIDDVSKINSSS